MLGHWLAPQCRTRSLTGAWTLRVEFKSKSSSTEVVGGFSVSAGRDVDYALVNSILQHLLSWDLHPPKHFDKWPVHQGCLVPHLTVFIFTCKATHLVQRQQLGSMWIFKTWRKYCRRAEPEVEVGAGIVIDPPAELPGIVLVISASTLNSTSPLA